MKTKFTKGEWIDLGYRVDVDIADGLSGICEMSDWMNKKEMEANAKLIAAAPELFEALIFCRSVIEKNGIYDVSDRMAFDKATNAIKKATE